MAIIKSDGRYTIRYIAKAVGISLSRVHFTLKRILIVRKISARTIPHILADDQKKPGTSTNRLAIAKNASQIHLKAICKYCYSWRNIVSLFRTSKKNGNKIWKTKHGRRPEVVKRTISTMKVLYRIFLLCDCIAVQYPVPKGKIVTGRYYRDVLKSWRKLL